MENITLGCLYNNLEAKIQKMKECAGLGMIWQSESQYQDAGVLLLPPGSKGMESKIRDSLNWLLPIIKNSYDTSSKIGVADCGSRNRMAADPA